MSSTGHAAKKGSDMQWIVSAVTFCSVHQFIHRSIFWHIDRLCSRLHSHCECWGHTLWCVGLTLSCAQIGYLLRPQEQDAHGHGHGHEHAAEHHEEHVVGSSHRVLLNFPDLWCSQSTEGEPMKDSDGTEVSAEEINKSMKQEFVSENLVLLLQFVKYICSSQDTDSPADAQTSEEHHEKYASGAPGQTEESEVDQDQEVGKGRSGGKKGTFQKNEDEGPRPTDMSDARKLAKVCAPEKNGFIPSCLPCCLS